MKINIHLSKLVKGPFDKSVRSLVRLHPGSPFLTLHLTSVDFTASFCMPVPERY